MLWLKADAIRGLTDGSPVQSWLDSSGNGRTAFQPTHAAQPSYAATALNGLPAVHFTASANSFLTTSLRLFATDASPLTVFVVFRAADVSAPRFLLQQPQTNCQNNLELGYGVGGAVPAGNFGLQAGCGIAAVASTAIAANTWYIGEVEIASTGNAPANVTFYENGAAQTTAALHDGWVAPNGYGTALREVVIGARDSLNNGAYDAFHDGDIAEILMFSAVSPTVRTSVEKYLHAKWGI
jgi:hypothetical protein